MGTDDRPVEFIEGMEASATAPAVMLDDDALRSAGMVPVRAWVRSSASANALRVAKAKARAEAERNVRQLNVTAPTDDASRDALKAVARALCEGTTSVERITAVMAPAAPERVVEVERIVERVVPAPLPPELEACRVALAHGGWRARAIRWLAHV